jgi:dimethylargininase
VQESRGRHSGSQVVTGLVAIVREVSRSIAQCELTHLDRQPIDLERARRQHEAYRQALLGMGCRVEILGADDSMPDSVFIEDTAIVTDEVAVVTRPGAATRRGETAAVRMALSHYRPLAEVTAPATLDGGDVVVAGRRVLVGQSSRTNAEGVEQLARALAPFGYQTRAVPLTRCLHLKSAVTALDDETLLIDPEWASPLDLPGFEFVEIDPREPGAANIVRVGPTYLFAQAFPRTLERLQRHGLDVTTTPCDELAKAEGAVTCCSLVFQSR